MSEDNQLFFPFVADPSFSLADYYVSSSNRDAFECLQRWPSWPALGLVIVGPEASGKTHLAHIWQQQSGARFFRPSTDEACINNFYIEGKKPFIFDETFPDEPNFFHLLNMMKDQEVSFLILKKTPISMDAFTLKDLRSRLLNLPCLTLKTPDDDLLKAIILKQLADAQIKIADSLITYIITHIGRTYTDARQFCKKLIYYVQGQRHNVTLNLVKKVLES